MDHNDVDQQDEGALMFLGALGRGLQWLNNRTRGLLLVKRAFLRLRLRYDLAAYDMSSTDKLPVAKIDLLQTCTANSCVAHCLSCVAHCLAFYDTMRAHIADRHFSWRNFYRPAALLVRVADFPTFATYKTAVSKASHGNDIRAANKARKLGYETRRIGLNSFLRSRDVIDKSKIFRSGVFFYALTGPPRNDLPDQEYPYAPPPCTRHWIIDWAVFRNRQGGGEMVGLGSLQRAGDFVHFRRFIGHGDALGDGVMKLLIFDMMEWILAREDPLVVGIGHLHYGSLEEGSAGMRRWKRYMQFRPYAVDIPYDHELEHFPKGFDAATYLRLNPDVARSGLSARWQYRWFGVHEGRRWREE